MSMRTFDETLLKKIPAVVFLALSAWYLSMGLSVEGVKEGDYWTHSLKGQHDIYKRNSNVFVLALMCAKCFPLAKAVGVDLEELGRADGNMWLHVGQCNCTWTHSDS